MSRTLVERYQGSSRWKFIIESYPNISIIIGITSKLRDIATYLEKVYNKNLPINHTILGKLQNVFNLLPNLVQPAGSSTTGEDAASGSELATAFTVKTNDELMIIYISTLVRAIIAFHDLIENKLENKKVNEKKALEPESLVEDRSAITSE